MGIGFAFLNFLAVLNIPGLFDSFAKNVSFALPVIMEYTHLDPHVRDSITNKLVEFYFDSQLTNEKVENLTNVKCIFFFVHLNEIW